MNDEILSRLLDGDLPPDQEAEARARIAADPELAARWQAMQALAVDLDALAPELPVPPGLDDRVLGADVSEVRWGRPLIAAAVLLAAAAVLLGLGLWSRPQASATAELALVEGSQRVRGEGVELMAGDTRVRVDGDAWVRVEPAAGAVRTPGQEDPMNPILSAAGGAVAGAVVTVAVVAGTASVWAPDAPASEPVVVQAGDTHRVGVPVSGANGGGEPTPEIEVVDASDPEALAREVGRLRFENQLLKGQLELHQGTPLEWPSDLPAGLRADGFDERARKAGEGVEGLEVVRTDCEEYPCILIARVSEGLDPSTLHEQLGAVEDALTGDADGDYNTFASVFQRDDGESASAFGLLAVTPGQEGEQELDPNLRTRLMERSRALESELSQRE